MHSSKSFHVLSTATLSLCTSLLMCCRRSQKLIWHTSQYPNFCPRPCANALSFSLVCVVLGLVSPHAFIFVFVGSVGFCWLLKRKKRIILEKSLISYISGPTFLLCVIPDAKLTYMEFVLEF